MRVVVKVRSVTLSIEVGHGRQTFLWLANQAQTRYARHIGLLAASLTPTDLVDGTGNPLWPHDTILPRLGGAGQVELTLVDAAVAPDRPPSLWERFARHEPTRYVKVAFVVDLRRFDDPVGNEDELADPNDAGAAAVAPGPGRVDVVGNFTNWRATIPLVEHGDHARLFKLDLMMPPGADLLFWFHVDQRRIVSVAHPIVLDGRGLRVNQIQVPLPDGHVVGHHTAAFKVYARPALDLTALGDAAVNAFAQARSVAFADRRKRFNDDWSAVGAREIVTVAADRLAVKEVLWQHADLLADVLQAYGSLDDPSRMTSAAVCAFCQRCRIPSTTLTLKQITDAFFLHRAGSDTIGRHDLYAGLVRLAMAKYGQMRPPAALATLMAFHVQPYALRALDDDDIRARIATRDVQALYERYAGALRDAFGRYAINGAGQRAITFGAVQTMLKDTGLVVDDGALAATFEDAAGEPTTTTTRDPTTSLVYAEYLEALARVADQRYREKVPLDVKLERLFGEVLFVEAATSTGARSASGVQE